MKKLQFSIQIHCSAQHAHKVMLDKETYRQWTKEFDPSSDFEGSWDKGSRILFTAMNQEGKKEGMIARIKENEPGRFVSIEHLGMLQNDIEITEGPEVEGWAGALENYTFSEENGVTTIVVEVDTDDKYVDYFGKTWPSALNRLKELCEKS